MGGQFRVGDIDEDHETYGASYEFLESLKGYFIRAAISYLENLSAKNISTNLLVSEGIIVLNADHDTAGDNSNEVVVITNYRLRIEAAIKLLRSWCREKVGDGRPDLTMMGLAKPKDDDNFDIEKLLKDREAALAAFDSDMIVDDPILGKEYYMKPGAKRFIEGMNHNFKLERISKTLPPVLKELKLQGLHHFVVHGDELTYEQAQDIVRFLDKMKPYLEAELGEYEKDSNVGEELRALFAACQEGRKVSFG